MATHKLEDDYIAEVLPGVSVPSSTSGSTALGSGSKKTAPRESGFEGRWGLALGVPKDWGKRSRLLKGAHKTCHVPELGAKAVIGQEPGPDLPAGLRESLGEVGEAGLWLTLGTKTLAEAILGSSSYWANMGSGRPHWGTWPVQQPVGTSAGTPQAKQLTGQGHSPTCQQTGRLKLPETTVASRRSPARHRDRTQLHPPTGGHQPNCPAVLLQALDKPHLPGGRYKMQESPSL